MFGLDDLHADAENDLSSERGFAKERMPFGSSGMVRSMSETTADRPKSVALGPLQLPGPEEGVPTKTFQRFVAWRHGPGRKLDKQGGSTSTEAECI